MSAAFEIAIEAVLAYEGGYVNDPRDPGGETKYGISKRRYPHLAIATLEREDAIAIYRRDYWQATGCEILPPALGIAVFDAAVNQGPKPAVSMLQACLGVASDGVVGFETTHAARGADVEKVLGDYFARRALRYAALSTFDRFGHGWMRRLFGVHRVCLQALP